MKSIDFYYACAHYILQKKTLSEVDWLFYYACIGQDLLSSYLFVVWSINVLFSSKFEKRH